MLRIAETKDHSLIAALNEEVQNLHHQMHPEVFKPFDKAGIEKMIAKFLTDENCKAYIAWKGEEPVGYIILFFRESGDNAFHYNTRSLYIDQIGVPQKHRRSGVGQALMQHAEQVASDNNISLIELDHWNANTVAAGYFRSHGYTLRKERLAKRL
jgi:ribosomal protein S18 acetylase RimI-like enzyme